MKSQFPRTVIKLKQNSFIPDARN